MRHPGIQGLLPKTPEIRSKRRLKNLLRWRRDWLDATKPKNILEYYAMITKCTWDTTCSYLSIPPSRTGRKFRPITHTELKERNLRP